MTAIGIPYAVGDGFRATALIDVDARADIDGIRFVNVDIDDIGSRDNVRNLELKRAELAVVLTHEHTIPIDGGVVTRLSYLQEITATWLDPRGRDVEILLVPDRGSAVLNRDLWRAPRLPSRRRDYLWLIQHITPIII